jgi:NADH-quinone oxidoreductase subunit M
MPWVSAIVLLPLAGAVAMFAVPEGNARVARAVAIATSLATAVLTACLVGMFDRNGAELQFVDEQAVSQRLGLGWNVGVDGVSLWLVVLTAGLFLLAIVAAAARTPERPRAFLGLLLLAEFGLLGLFASGDLVLFYVFWEAMLVPFAFLMWMWGAANRGRATLTFVIYTMIGSLLMLVAILSAGFLAQSGDDPITFNITALTQHDWTATESTWLFATFALAFVIKLPLFPFHGWMPSAYAAAPLLVTALLSAVMSKAGAYGLLRIGLPMFPEGAERLASVISVLAVIGIIYGSLIAWRAQTMRMLVAYSSLAHLGFIVLGIMAFNEMAAQGAVLQMVNHGIVTAAAFAIVGIVARAKHGDEEMDRISGLANGAPWLAGIFLVVAMAALAIPGSNAFVGEFFILAGVFQEQPLLAILACFGVVYASVYMLRLYQSSMNGPKNGDAARAELTWRDGAYLLPLVGAMLFIALWPAAITGSTSESVKSAVAAPASIAAGYCWQVLPPDELQAGEDLGDVGDCVGAPSAVDSDVLEEAAP